MDEIMKNDLLKKLYLLQKDRNFEEKLKENNSINAELIGVINQIIIYYVKNKSRDKEDLIYLRNMLNYFIKTGKVKYDGSAKVKRLNRVIDNISR
ncbi:MAG TPA: hypothetical protein VLL98_04115 [Rickettsiales bacterium]|nr:hypothetical protein [Rickettsiales bacterium]